MNVTLWDTSSDVRKELSIQDDRTESDNRIEVMLLIGIAENNLPHIARWESTKPPYAEPHVRWCGRSVNVKIGGKCLLWLAFTSYPIIRNEGAVDGYWGSSDEYRGLFSSGPKKTSYPCKTGRQVWDDAEAVHIRTVSTWSKNKKYSWHDQKLFGLLCLYHPSVEMTRRAVAATPPESWTAIISKTYVIRCI